MPGRERPRRSPGRGRAASQRSAASKRNAERAARSAHGPRGSRSRGAAARTRTPVRRRPAAARRATPARGRRFPAPDPARVAAALDGLAKVYPAARCELDFRTPLQLLIATILSAQCTDQRVNMVTPALFARFPDAESLANAGTEELEELIRSTGFYRNKARAIRECCADIVKLHGGEVPRTLEALVALHGVGRKTANVVLGNAFGIPGLVVDTHVTRLSNRLGFVRELDAVKIEFALMEIVPREQWTVFSHWLILHGRRVCIARKPACSTCAILAHCPRLGVTAHR